MSLEGNTLWNIIGDIDRSVVKNKLKSVIILNGHHGNALSLKLAERKIILQRPARMRKVRFYSYWHFMKHEFDHAGFVETSIMLTISDKVKMKKAKKGFTTKGLSETPKKFFTSPRSVSWLKTIAGISRRLAQLPRHERVKRSETSSRSGLRDCKIVLTCRVERITR